MEIESVIEFLSHVPLLQRLPTSSLHKIAQLIQFKHYNSGEYVSREGEIKCGIYFIWQGEVEVRGVSVNVESEDHSEIQLRRYDYFGHGAVSSSHEADVSALTKLTCLMLPSEYSTLLQPKSIWAAEETHDEGLLMVERVLQLEPIDVNIFRGFTLPEAPTFAQVFGGQLIAQSPAAATKTVDCGKFVHSLHNYLLLVGNLNIPVIYEVHQLRDGNSFATRRVDAIQNGNLIFTLLASFQEEDNLSIYGNHLSERSRESLYSSITWTCSRESHFLFAELEYNFTSNDGRGTSNFMRLSQLHDPAKGYLVKDTCVVRVEVTCKMEANDEGCEPSQPTISQQRPGKTFSVVRTRGMQTWFQNISPAKSRKKGNN